MFPLFPLSVIFFISSLAETNRIPFDLPEAEAELVAGYNVEFSGFTFAAFFLGEYSNILLMCFLFVLFFLGGGDFSYSSFFELHSYLLVFLFDLILGLKVIVFVFLFVFIRANLPRFRFDQLMYIGWKVFLPLNLALVIFYPCFLLVFNSLVLVQYPHLTSNFCYIETFAIRY